MKVLKFRCDKNLKRFTNSMLFDSHCDEIAYAEIKHEGFILNIRLEVNGYVNVEWEGDTYRCPSDFPEELRELIRNNPYWDTDDRVYVDENNWFEYLYGEKSGKVEIYTGGIVEESDISEMTPEDIKEQMLDIAKWYFEEEQRGCNRE